MPKETLLICKLHDPQRAKKLQLSQTHVHHVQICGSQWHLLILGDGFDFLHTHAEDDATGIFLAATFSNSRKKTGSDLYCSPQFFDSLGLLLAKGFHVEIVSGNHDINSFADLLAPVKDPVMGEIAHPIAAYFDLYLFHLLKHIAPLTGTVRAPLPHLLNRICKNPLVSLAKTPPIFNL